MRRWPRPSARSSDGEPGGGTAPQSKRRSEVAAGNPRARLANTSLRPSCLTSVQDDRPSRSLREGGSGGVNAFDGNVTMIKPTEERERPHLRF